MSEEAWMEYLNEDDPVIQETQKVFRSGTAFPTAPATNNDMKKAAYVKPFDYRGPHTTTTSIAYMS